MSKTDELIATHINDTCYTTNYTPSTRIDLAWKVVEKLASKGAQIRLSNKAMNNDYWWCYLSLDDADIGLRDVTAQGKSAPEAICLAALKLYGIEI